MSAADDHFSAIADRYARGRIDYPRALYEHLSSHCGERKLAWDCATGTGQAAKGLAPLFE